MRATQFIGRGQLSGLTPKVNEWDSENRVTRSKMLPSRRPGEISNLNSRKRCREVRFRDGECRITSVTRCSSPIFQVFNRSVSSELGADASDADDKCVLDKEKNFSGLNESDSELIQISNASSNSWDVKRELLMLSVPAFAGQAIEPVAQLMETAYIGRLGPLELASAAVSMSIFNLVSKLFNIPLLSVATSSVAEDISQNALDSSRDNILGEESNNGKPFSETNQKRRLSSVPTALLLAVGIGIFEALTLSLGSGVLLNLMGVSSASSMRAPALRFLSLRALGAPAVVTSLALQGIYRGFKDTKTPLMCLGAGNFLAAFLFPLFIYYFQLGITGAAISSVVSQYSITFLMLWYLNKKAVLLPPKMEGLQFGSYIRSGGFLLGRTLAVLSTMTLGTSMAARQGPVAMAAHQICLQVWLAVSLLTDSLAASGQALIASFLSKGDYIAVREITDVVLKIGLIAGVVLGVILAAFFGQMAGLFTKDAGVVEILKTGVLFVSASQPINSLAFIYDGFHYGVSDFMYAACSMMLVGAVSSTFLLWASPIFGLQGVWSGLALFMGLRTVAGYLRLRSRTGPWWFLHKDPRAAMVSDFTCNPAVFP